MATLTALAAAHGFTTGDLNTDGYFAAIPCLQKLYLCDGRTVIDNGMHKLDFINTKLTFTTAPSGAFTAGEILTQATSGAKGVYDECIDKTIVGTITGTFTAGEKVTQATTLAVGYVAKANTEATTVWIYQVSGTFATGTYTITGATSAATLANPSSISAIGAYHFVYRITTTQFNVSNIITGGTSGKTGTPAAVTAPPHWLPWILTTGTFPDGGSNIASLFLGRIYLNDMYHPNQWLCLRQGNPLDGATSVVETDVGGATSSQVSEVGKVGDQLIAFIPYRNLYQIFGCATQIWIQRGDPRQGGTLACLFAGDGIFSPESYCFDDRGNLYILGLTGFYKFSPDIATSDTPPDNVLTAIYPELVRDLALNRRTDRAVVAYDKDRQGVLVSVCMKDGAWHNAFFYDLKAGGIYPEQYASAAIPASAFFHDSYKGELRSLLLGGQDGYIRKFDETTASDATTSSTAAIESYVVLGPIELNAEQTRGEGRVDEIQIDLSEEVTNCDWAVYTGKTAQAVIDNIVAGANPIDSGSFTTNQNSIRTKFRGQWLAIKLGNSTIDKTWSLEGCEAAITVTSPSKE